MPTIGLKTGLMIEISKAEFEKLSEQPNYSLTNLKKVNGVAGRFTLAPDSVAFVSDVDPDELNESMAPPDAPVKKKRVVKRKPTVRKKPLPKKTVVKSPDDEAVPPINPYTSKD